MKQRRIPFLSYKLTTFSALGRAVWDETLPPWSGSIETNTLSVLSVEPYGMKHKGQVIPANPVYSFSALGRAVWDET